MTGELIKTPTDELLQKFGSGGHKPGSGSAAALLALMSCKLIQTVATLTSQRDHYKEATESLSAIVEGMAAEIEPRLMDLFQEDSAQFDRAIAARRARDAETDPAAKRRLAAESLAELRAATEIPLEIAQLSIQLGQHAASVFDLGFKSARGDSVVAITSAHAAAGGCIAIAYLNLTSFRGSHWAIQTRERTDELATSWNALGASAASRISIVRDRVIDQEKTGEPSGGRVRPPEDDT